MRSYALLLALIATSLALTACGEAASDRESAPPVDIGTLPGVYAGVFPCENCLATDARLWLRPDGIYFMSQDRRAAEDGEVESTHTIGLWAWDTGDRELVLRAHGPERRFYYAEDTLRMLVPGAPHMLERDGAGAPFTDRLPLEGQYESSAAAGTFTECVTGLRLPVRDDAAGRNLRRRQRGVSAASRPVWVSIEGHLIYGQAEVLAVDRVLAMRPGRGC